MQNVAKPSITGVKPLNASQAFGVRVGKAIGRSRVAKRGALQTTAGLNMVFVSAEVTPWSKTGGLGDVVGGLPVELAKKGHKVMTIAPR